MHPSPTTPGHRPSSDHWTAEGYRTHAQYVPMFGQDVLDLLAPQPGERILDLGCGDGALTEKLAAVGADVVGVDGSPDMIAAAKARGIDARLVDGQNLPFSMEFDAVFSNAALHWMKRPADVVAGVRRALKPGGRFVGEMGGHGNVAAIRVGLHAVLTHRGIDPLPLDPWFFPTPEAYRTLLEGVDLRVETLQLFARPTPLPTGMAGWIATFAPSFLGGLSPELRAEVADEVATLLRPMLRDHGGQWMADYVRLRFAAFAPSA